VVEFHHFPKKNFKKREKVDTVKGPTEFGLFQKEKWGWGGKLGAAGWAEKGGGGEGKCVDCSGRGDTPCLQLGKSV